VIAAPDAVIVARPAASDLEGRRTSSERHAYRAEQRDCAIEIVHRYNPNAVVCLGPPFGHTRPQWIVPYGGTMTVDGSSHKIWADYT
jgi:muramoyltetrapeptide carboxypeptidase LdcA involved in peptidoglycan recycling